MLLGLVPGSPEVQGPRSSRAMSTPLWPTSEGVQHFLNGPVSCNQAAAHPLHS